MNVAHPSLIRPQLGVDPLKVFAHNNLCGKSIQLSIVFVTISVDIYRIQQIKNDLRTSAIVSHVLIFIRPGAQLCTQQQMHYEARLSVKDLH